MTKNNMKQSTSNDWVRVVMTLTVLWCCLTNVWADDVTAEQAKAQAQIFLQSHLANGMRKGTKGTTLQLSKEMVVNGLYVFNVGDNRGFVVVSNDDSATPILGFSDSGSIDPDNMPSSMRAWLAGYADEIAWLQKNGNNTIVPKSALAKTSSWNVGEPKTPIAPLLRTTWDQGEPYNNLCPEYETGKNSATGCVATAMAQVMNYHQWPKAVPKKENEEYAIGSYTDGYGVTHAALPPVTFDWNNMLTNYVQKDGNQTTDAQKTAVATLMQYCGWGAKMDYNQESTSNSGKAKNALVTYFDYSAQYVSRSYYSYANWIDLIYYELAHQRPVIYGGQSSGGGHEFVCDGYMYENDTDFFHINWGWGGSSDQYFVLSVLNPREQGVGGSSSNDGFHYGQEAIIGIQKKSNTPDPIADITPNTVSLTLNSLTLNNKSVNADTPMEVGVGASVTAILNVTNNSTDAYDGGDIYLGYKYNGNGYYLADGTDAHIPAQGTTDCTIIFRPTEVGTYELYFFVPDAAYSSYSTDGVKRATLTAVASVTPIDCVVNYTNGLTAEVSWTNAATATAYDLDVNGAIIENVTSPYTLTDLRVATEYKVKVRAKVGDVLHKWTKVGSFTTESTPVPTDLAANATPVSATMTWNGNTDATGYNLRYGVRTGTGASRWLQYDDGTFKGSIGTGSAAEWTWGVMYPGEQVTGNKLTKVLFYEVPANITSNTNITIKIYSGVDRPSGTPIHTQEVSPMSDAGFHEITFDTPVSITPAANLWITLTATGDYPIPYCELGKAELNGQWIDNGGWSALDNSKECWMIRGYIEDEVAEWTTIENVTSPYKLAGLTSETEYAVQVQAVYAGGTSSWTNSAVFTTIPGIALSDVATNNSSVIESNKNQTVSVVLDGRTLWRDNEWNTICLPFDVALNASPLAGATALPLSEASITDNTLNLTFGNAVTTLTAGTPYIIKWAAAETNIVDPVFTGVTIKQGTTDKKCTLGAEKSLTFKGSYDYQAFDAIDQSVLFLGTENTLYYPMEGATIGAQRAYFKLEGITAADLPVYNVRILFVEDNSATEILTVEGEDLAVEREGWYTLTGVKLEDKPSERGVYIYNGRKVMIP